MEIYDVVKKLTGPIHPIGKAGEDHVRWINLNNTINLVEQLLGDIQSVSETKDKDISVKEARNQAKKFLIQVKNAL